MAIEERDSAGRILPGGAKLSRERAQELARLSHAKRRANKKPAVDALAESVLAALEPMPPGPAADLRAEIVRKAAQVAQGKSHEAVTALRQLDRMIPRKRVWKAREVTGGRMEGEWQEVPDTPPQAPPPPSSSAGKPRPNPCADLILPRGGSMPVLKFTGDIRAPRR